MEYIISASIIVIKLFNIPACANNLLNFVFFNDYILHASPLYAKYSNNFFNNKIDY